MSNTSWVIAVIALMLSGLLQTGCAISPTGRIDAMAKEHALIRGHVTGNGFRLRYYRNRRMVPGEPVRIYLEGDGLPWLRPNLMARDPTTRNPVALRLMLKDPGPAVYLGRPCYHQLDDRPLCTPWHWTAGRYSGTVVDSMATAIKKLTGTEPASTRIGLVGYSGGGALAMLIAQRLPQVDHVITIAGNLDPSAWTSLHGYSPLTGSENPSRYPPLHGSIAHKAVCSHPTYLPLKPSLKADSPLLSRSPLPPLSCSALHHECTICPFPGNQMTSTRVDRPTPIV